MNLFSTFIPKEKCEELELYVRTNGIIHNSTVLLKNNEYCRFDTLCNSLPCYKYKKYTQIDEMEIDVNISGKAKIELHCCSIKNNYIEDKIVLTRTTEYIEKTKMTLKIKNVELTRFDNYIIYPVVYAISDVIVYGFDYNACIEADEYACAFVICTYKREEFAIRNANKLSTVLSRIKNCKFKIIVSDNASSIDCGQLEGQNTILLKNKNLGGSGGFIKGIVKALEFSPKHIILMDDDIDFDEICIKKTISFMRLIKKEFMDITLAGTMHYLNEPYKQFQLGAYLDENFEQHGIKMLCDMRSKFNVMKNDIEQRIDVSGWWYMAIPASAFINHGLPIQMFIKYDDVEFSIRCKMKFVSINGVAIRHELFEKKKTLWLDYYNTRNYLITRIIHDENFNDKIFCKYVLALVNSKLKIYDYKAIKMILFGVSDFLKGPKVLNNASRIHNYIGKYHYQLYDDTGPIRDTWANNKNEICKNNQMMSVIDMFNYNDWNYSVYKRIALFNGFTNQYYVTTYSPIFNMYYKIKIKMLTKYHCKNISKLKKPYQNYEESEVCI